MRTYRTYRYIYRPGRRGVIKVSNRYKPAPDNRMGLFVIAFAVACAVASIVGGAS